MNKTLKIILKIIGIVIAVIVLLAVILVAWLSIKEYKPADVEDAKVISSEDTITVQAGRDYDILSWNIGFAGLGKDADFFMDGGKNVVTGDKTTVLDNIEGIKAYLTASGADFSMLQEVDIDSKRTYGINETEVLSLGSSSHAYNYSCPFVPYPIPPIGKVNSGVFTTTDYKIESSKRIALPCPFSWPVRAANLKRCLLVSYLPVEGSDKQLVLVNLHLEAYDDGEGKIAQTKMLREFILEEYKKGNYVIAGGDFNQTFEGCMEKYPMLDSSYWAPGVLDDSYLSEGLKFIYDTEVPSCRLLNQPYDKETNQHYVLDGFIISPNVKLNSVKNADLGFEFSDHNPVLINITLE